MQVRAGEVAFRSPHLNSQEHKPTQGGSLDERRRGLKSEFWGAPPFGGQGGNPEGV